MPLSREQLAQRAARELRDGFIVNLGIGIPTLVANYVPTGRHSTSLTPSSLAHETVATRVAIVWPNCLHPNPPHVGKRDIVYQGQSKTQPRLTHPRPSPPLGGSQMRTCWFTLTILHLGTLCFISLGVAASAALAQPADYGYQFATVTAPGNAPYGGPDPYNAGVVGRGSVNYDYRIAKTEVSTGQWMEFLNAVGGVDARPNQFFTPFRGVWGALPAGGHYELDPGLPDAANNPVFGITWREAAMYCNWLHNDKANATTALLTGAYDVATWGTLPNRQFTDASTHLPGAKYWLPTWDEQLKAFYYDPNRYGPNQPGWWQSTNRSDTPGISGLPGVGTTSAGYDEPNNVGAAFFIPLGAYADQTSPWGLLDTSGGGSEWDEEVRPGNTDSGNVRFARGWIGAAAGSFPGLANDHIYVWGGQYPDAITQSSSFRIASSIPGPGGCGAFVGLYLVCLSRRRNNG